MKSLFLRRALVAGLLSLGLLGFGYGLMQRFAGRTPKVRQMTFSENRKQVAVKPIFYESREVALAGLGRVVSATAVDIAAEVQGEILAGDVPLKQGQRFRKGQVLFLVENEEARLNLSASRSNFMTTVASVLPDLKVDFSEAFPIWEAYFNELDVNEPLPPLPDISPGKQKVFFSTQNLINQYYSIKATEERLDKYVVKAPFSGTFLDVLQEAHSIANPGTRVARIARAGGLEIEVPLQQQDLPFVKPGMAVKVMAENGEKTWPGRVSRLGSTIDPATQSLNVYLTFNPGRDLAFEGQYLQVELPGSRILDVMEIPRSAVVDRTKVYLVQDSVLVEQEVRVAKYNPNSVYFSGPEPGTLVVIEPLLRAYDNMPVTPVMEEE
jgi:membrane fusion protein, multidrug efflux system